MKIAYLCNEYPPLPHGGIGTFVRTIAHGMRAAGHEVTVVGWRGTAGERDDSGVRVVTLPECRTRRVAWILNRYRLHRWLRREAENGRIDLIETPEFGGMMPFRFASCPVVVRLHQSATAIAAHTRRRAPFALRWCEKRTLWLHRDWIAVSRFASDLTGQTFGFRGRRVAVVYSPVDEPSGVPPVPAGLPGRFVFYAGTVSRFKGAYVLAEAARVFLRNWADLHLVYAGALADEGGGAADKKIREIAGPELEARIRFLGRIRRCDVLACMRRAEVFAFPSTLETFGIVIAEAMLQGCPVVVCRGGPCEEFVEHESNGLLVPTDDPQAVADAIERLLSDRVLASRMAAKARERIREMCSVERAVRSSLAFYEECRADMES